MTMPKIVLHPRSGERYIFEEADRPGGRVYRASGPLLASDEPTEDEMTEWLDDDPDAYEDGYWFAAELYGAQ